MLFDIERLRRLQRFTCVAILLATVHMGHAENQESDSVSPVESPFDIEPADSELTDEIVIVGEKSKSQLRREIVAIERDILRLFNDANPDNDYDIVCKKEARIGSQIPRTNCKARIYWDALAELAEDYDSAIQTNRPLPNPARHAEKLRTKMLEFAEQDPQLLQALVKRKLLQKSLEDRKQD